MEKEWEFLEELVYKIPKHKTKIYAKINGDEVWGHYKLFCNKNHYDISKLGRRRFSFMFNRTIIGTLNKTSEYKDVVEKYKSNDKTIYKIKYLELIKYFNKGKKITQDLSGEDEDDSDEDDCINLNRNFY